MAEIVQLDILSGMNGGQRLLEAFAAAKKKLIRDIGAKQILNIKERVGRRESHEGGTYSASKRAQRDGGTTLLDTGAMLKAMKASNWTENSVDIGFGSAWETQKAVWAQEGTKAHEIKGNPALVFRTSMSFATHFIGNVKGIQSLVQLTQANARSNARGVRFARHVHHPGTPPRPFFGVSTEDKRKLIELGQKIVEQEMTRG